MVPTLQVGDHIVVSKLAYGLHLPIVNKWLWRRERPNRGDVVVFFRFSKFETFDVQKHYIKRIVAVPGDLVEVRERIAYVNDRPTEYGAPELFQVAPSDDEAAAEAYGPVKLKSDEYFVLGDNRSNSRDSRYFGPIHFSDIQGKANLIYWSSERLDGKLRIRWDRIGKAIE